ncbi:M56 family metallopeptidase [Sphingosinicella sp. BN140058]|uniref:M56 family metallopeptidase n=1 Tax=Sphingosinicella sp. BN140058 TaxID=1892855 RepID=UPI0010105A6F|nr:M56 family metallopeptidase [Sphingosinicella sp. BN140058]QAY78519.1 hypothetical protein ETR14_19715 [Sphingosinicella sp. BN140058]
MIGWLVETLITVTILMLLVLAVRGPVARTFGAGWAYALWIVPAVRLVLPALPALTPNIALPAAAFIPAAVGSTAPSPAHPGPGQWVPFMLAMWAGGAVIFLVLQWLAYRDFVQRLGKTARPARPPSYGGILTLASQAVDGPLAMGLIARRIVVPTDFLRRYSDGERRLALEHELTHHRRGDIWWNMVATLVLALTWFNPIAWVAFRAFRTDQELSCDAAVAAKASADERWDYARALVKSACRPGLIAACSLNGSDALKRRLRMLGGHRASLGRSLGGMLALGLFTTIGFGVGKPDFVIAAAPVASAASPTPTAPASSLRIAASNSVTRPTSVRAAPVPTPRPVRVAIAAPARPAARAVAAAPTAAPEPAPAPAAVQAPIAPIALPHHPAQAASARQPALREALAAAAAVALRARPIHRLELRDDEPDEEQEEDGAQILVVTWAASAHAPVGNSDGAVDRLRALTGGGGGSVQTHFLAQVAEAKVVLRGLRFRAPDMWHEVPTEDCVH